MKPAVKDPQLDDELRELYLECKHWLSDIHFAEDEVRFFKKMVNNYLVPAHKNEQLTEIEDFNRAFVMQSSTFPCLKSEITELLTLIGTLINAANRDIGIDLTEKFAALEIEMNVLLESVKQAKNRLFLFTENIMKAECDAFISKLQPDEHSVQEIIVR